MMKVSLVKTKYEHLVRAMQLIDIDNGAGIIPGVLLKNEYWITPASYSVFAGQSSDSVMSLIENFNNSLGLLSEDEMDTFTSGEASDQDLIVEKYKSEGMDLISTFLNEWFDSAETEDEKSFTWHQIWYITKVYPESVTAEEAYESYISSYPPQDDGNGRDERLEGNESWSRAVAAKLGILIREYVPEVHESEGDEPINTEATNQ